MQLLPFGINARKKTFRNQPCPCGSGKKYKRCHLNRPKAPSGSEFSAAIAVVDDNAPCPCGSKRRYKSCHKRKRAPGARRKSTWVWPIAVAIGGLAAGATIIVTRGNILGGVSFALAGVIIGGIAATFRRWPDPHDHQPCDDRDIEYGIADGLLNDVTRDL